MARHGRLRRATARVLPVASIERVAEALVATPARITLVYLAFGFSALWISDAVLPTLLSGSALAHVQAAKGTTEVLLTGGLLYVLVSGSQASIRRTKAEIERHREELRVLHRVLRHNLRNNLNVVLGNGRLLRSQLTDPEQRETCDTVLEAAEEILECTRQAQEIRRLTTDDRPIELDLAEAIPEILATNDHVTDAVDVETTLPETAPVQASTQLAVAIDELVTNAVQHSDRDEPRVRVTVERGDRLTTVEVADDGPGLPEHAEAVLRGTERDQVVHLEGLGLWLAYLTVVESGGRFEIENRGDGATVRIELPTAA